jgi:hypothetical protein
MASVIDEGMIIVHWLNDIDRGNPIPVALCMSQISHGPALDGTRASDVRGRELDIQYSTFFQNICN